MQSTHVCLSFYPWNYSGTWNWPCSPGWIPIHEQWQYPLYQKRKLYSWIPWIRHKISGSLATIYTVRISWNLRDLSKFILPSFRLRKVLEVTPDWWVNKLYQSLLLIYRFSHCLQAIVHLNNRLEGICSRMTEQLTQEVWMSSIWEIQCPNAWSVSIQSWLGISYRQLLLK